MESGWIRRKSWNGWPRISSAQLQSPTWCVRSPSLANRPRSIPFTSRRLVLRGQMWVAKGPGLLLREEMDMDVGGGEHGQKPPFHAL
jgi:hypothetical protein